MIRTTATLIPAALLTGALLTGPLLVGASLLASAAHSPAVAEEAEIESPDYDVVDRLGEVEIRDYASHLVASVTVEAESLRAASSKGFRPLAAYIFGGNAPAEEIAMTAPVTTRPAVAEGTGIAMTAPVTTSAASSGDGGGNAYTVRFTMPSRWTMETLPRPLNDAVTLEEIPARTMAAIRYVGREGERREAKSRALLEALDGSDYAPVGEIVHAGYDGPATPAAERRWDVMVEVSR